MTTRTSASLKHAFKRFVELVKPIDDVRHVVATDYEEPDIYTFITRRDEAVMFDVFQAEYRIMEEFPDLPVDFHVRYLEGKKPEDFMKPLPALAYSRQA
jgi:hypothetical protein